MLLATDLQYLCSISSAVLLNLSSVNDCFSIDASRNERLGRYVNDSPERFANSAPKVMVICGKPRLLLFATKDIAAGTELRYNYGGGGLPWRKVSRMLKMLYYAL